MPPDQARNRTSVTANLLPITCRISKPFLQSVVVFVCLSALIHFAVSTERDRIKQNLRNEITQVAIGTASRLEAELNANVFLANGLVPFVTAVQGPQDSEFEAALKSIHQFGRHIRNVGAAPGNRIRYVYPKKGNEAALGLYYPDVPDQWGAIKKAIDNRTTSLAGPVKLRQGGTGLISRTPIFFEDGRYWGILSLVLDANSLFREVGLGQEVKGIKLAMRGKDGAGAAGEIFLGEAAVFGTGAIKVPVHIPGGTWIIAAMPVDGWNAGQGNLFAVEALAFLAAVFPALLLYRYQKGRQLVAISEQRMRAFMETAQDGVVVINDSGIIHEFNGAAETLFGYTTDELIGTSLNALMPEAEAKQHDNRLKNPHFTGTRTMAKGRQIVCLRKDGSTFPAEITVGNALVDDKYMYVGVIRDITERKAFEQKLIDIASIDSLTGALTRRAFLEDAQDIFQLAHRHARPLSMLMADADFFKNVNDTYGHHVGDMVLVRLTGIFKDCLRTTDKLGRMGGEEFALLLPETDQTHAIVVVDRLLNAVREAVISTDAGDTLKITVSIGLVTLTPQTSSLMTLLQQADEALYEAKEMGRNRYQVFSGRA